MYTAAMSQQNMTSQKKLWRHNRLPSFMHCPKNYDIDSLITDWLESQFLTVSVYKKSSQDTLYT